MARFNAVLRILLLGLAALLLAVYAPRQTSKSTITNVAKNGLRDIIRVDNITIVPYDRDRFAPRLTRRVIGTPVSGSSDDAEWCQSIKRGTDLLNYMTNGGAPAPVTTSYASLAASGWSVNTPATGISLFALTDAFADLNLGTAVSNGAANLRSYALQNLRYPQPAGTYPARKPWDVSVAVVMENLPAEHVTYQPTRADYKNILNPGRGVIIAANNFGPAYKIKQGFGANPNNPLPELSNWSDVIYLEWAKRSSVLNKRNLKYVIRYNVANPETRRLIARALNEAGYDSSLGPPLYTNKVVLLMTGDPGKAILGAPNGRGVGYLLAQHQGPLQFGKKTVTQVTMFDQTYTGQARKIEYWSPQLIFYIRSV